MKKLLFSCLVACLAISLYALNAEPPELRVQDFKCRYDKRVVLVEDVAVDYECVNKGNEKLKLSIIYYGKKQNKEQQRQILAAYAKREEQTETVRLDPVNDERGLALYKISSMDTNFGSLTLARFDDDKRVVLEGYLPMPTLQKLASNKKAEEMLKAILALDVPADSF